MSTEDFLQFCRDVFEADGNNQIHQVVFFRAIHAAYVYPNAERPAGISDQPVEIGRGLREQKDER